MPAVRPTPQRGSRSRPNRLVRWRPGSEPGVMGRETHDAAVQASVPCRLRSSRDRAVPRVLRGRYADRSRRSDPGRVPRPRGHHQVRDPAAHPAGHAPGAARSRSGAASRSTTTRSRCGSCRSRSCRPVCRRRPSGATARCRASATAASCSTTLRHSPSRRERNRPVRVKWINELVDADGNYLPHLLPVDPTLHWANPPGGATGRDTRPEFDDDARAATPVRSRS